MLGLSIMYITFACIRSSDNTFNSELEGILGEQIGRRHSVERLATCYIILNNIK